MQEDRKNNIRWNKRKVEGGKNIEMRQKMDESRKEV